METVNDRPLYILLTVSYTHDGKYIQTDRPRIISIQYIKLTTKMKINGYRWMKKAGLIWLTFDEFRKLHPMDFLHLAEQYNRKWVGVFKMLLK